MRKTMLGLVLAALMTAAWAEPAPAVQYPASAVEAVAAGSDYTYEELLACLTGVGCTEAEALAYAGEPVEAPEGAAAVPMVPSESCTVALTVGFPRESKISQPYTFWIFTM